MNRYELTCSELAILTLLVILVIPLISFPPLNPTNVSNRTANKTVISALGVAATAVTGTYQTNTGIISITVDGAEFVGGNTAAPLDIYGTRTYEFMASADHLLTFQASAQSNPFGSGTTGVYNQLSVSVDDDSQTVNGTDTQLAIAETIDLAHPSNGNPEHTITVVYGQPYCSGGCPAGYPDYYYGHTFEVLIHTIPIVTLNANVTGTITLPQPVGNQNEETDVLLAGQVLPPKATLETRIFIDGSLWQDAFSVATDSRGSFNYTWPFDNVGQFADYGTASALYTFVVNYTGTSMLSNFATPQMLASASASVDVTVVVSPPGVIPPPTTNSTEHLPVIIIPGVGGSELDTLSGMRGSEVWPAPSGTHIPQVLTHLWQLTTKVDMGVLRLNSDGTAPADPNVYIFASDILRSGLSNFYGGLVTFLESKGYEEGKSLFVFPYDWRLDNTLHLDALDRLVNQARATNGSQKVILVAHSMGGLIATAYVNSDPARAAKVDSIITMGTPFWGSPKVYYALTEGYALGNVFADLQQMKSMMQEWPAVYELLPKKPFILKSASGDYFPLDQTFDITYKAAYSDTPWQFNSAVLEKAYAFNSLLGSPNSPSLPTDVKLYTIIGYGTQTLNGYTIRAPTTDELTKNMTVKINEANVVLVPQFDDGDGTVPLWGLENSAATARYCVRTNPTPLFGDSAAHGDLPDNTKAQAIVWSIVNNTALSPEDFLYAPGSAGPHSIESVDLTVHSNVNLEILDQNDGMMGWNTNNGTIFEMLPQGTFLDQDGIQYASIQNSSIPYTLFLNGTDNGNFTMIINITRAGTTTVFSYSDIPVVNGTVAQLPLNPREISSSLSSLTVTSNGITKSFLPKLISQTTASGSQIPPFLNNLPIFIAVGLIITVSVAVAIAVKRRRVPPPPPPLSYQSAPELPGSSTHLTT
jgi:pimeloyl-ACP methyl ester carboxylesterase